MIVFVIAEFVSGIRGEGWRSLKLFTGNFRILFPLSAKNLSSPLNTPIRTLLSPFDKRIPLLFSDSSFYPDPGARTGDLLFYFSLGFAQIRLFVIFVRPRASIYFATISRAPNGTMNFQLANNER